METETPLLQSQAGTGSVGGYRDSITTEPSGYRECRWTPRLHHYRAERVQGVSVNTKPSDRYKLKPDKFIMVSLQMTEEYCIYKHPLHKKDISGIAHTRECRGGGGRGETERE